MIVLFQTNNVAGDFVQSVLDLFIIRHWYCNICCADPFLIKEVQFLPILQTGTEAWRERPLAWGDVRALAEQEIEKSWTNIQGNCDLFLHHIWLLGPVSKMIITAAYTVSKSTVPYGARSKGSEDHWARTACSFKQCQKLILICKS